MGVVRIEFTKDVDAVFDSVSIATTFKKELAQYGVIFSSISEAIHDYSGFIEKYLGTVVPIGDNYFSALNSAIFTDGSFCYIPKDVICPLDLSTYFRMNDEKSSFFLYVTIVLRRNGLMPEWLKGVDCKSAVLCYVGSNPTRPSYMNSL